jgi:hypothetical protein
LAIPIHTFAHPEHRAPGSFVINRRRRLQTKRQKSKSGRSENDPDHLQSPWLITQLTPVTSLAVPTDGRLKGPVLSAKGTSQFDAFTCTLGRAGEDYIRDVNFVRRRINGGRSESKQIATVNLLCPIFAVENDKELIMRKGLGLFVALAVVFVMSNFTVQAMPASSSKSLTKNSGQITLVAGGCGRGFHRGPRGRCIPN